MKEQTVIQLAEKLLKQQSTSSKNPFASRLKTIIEVPESKHFLIQMMDVAFRSKNYKKVAEHVIYLLKSHKNYEVLFTPIENVLLKTFAVAGKVIPSVSVAIMLKKIQATSSDVVFFINSKKFQKHIQKRKEENITLNVNLIGEALIGEEEAKGEHRADHQNRQNHHVARHILILSRFARSHRHSTPP